VTVWDQKGDPSLAIGEVLCWQSFAHGEGQCSIPRYLEDHAERLRAKYLAFIHDLGEARVGEKRIIDHLEMGEGFSFWWMTELAEKSPFKSPQIYGCLRLLALEEILLEKKPSGLTLASADRNLARAIEKLCQNLRIEFVWQSCKPSRKFSRRKLYDALPYPIQGLIGLVRHLGLRWPLRRLQKPQWFSDKNATFLCAYFSHLDQASCAQGRFHSRQWEVLPEWLHGHGGRTNWIHHFLFSAAVPDVRTGLSWLRLFNREAEQQGYHAFLDTYLTWGIVVRVLKNWIWLNTIAWRLRRVDAVFYPTGSAVWLWPVLRGNWQASLNGSVAINNCLWLELFDAALKDIPHQERGLYIWENQGWERALLRAWRKHQHGKITGVQHATVPFWHLNNFHDRRSYESGQNCPMPLPDRLAVNGPVPFKAFVGAGYPVEQLVEVEALRYLKLTRTDATPVLDSMNPLAGKQPIPGSLGVRVIVLGDFVPAIVRSFLRLLEEATKLLPSSYQFTFKPHPACAVRLADYPDLRADETTEALDRILEKYDMALATNSTSASVDAYMAGLPVIIALDGADLNLSPLRGQPGVRFVRTPSELVEALSAPGLGATTHAEQNNFFFLDSELPRWKQLLSSAS
jgi:surface carbohydrate biosynthesis protein (TIGR04326 family)